MKKKSLYLLIGALVAFNLTACGNQKTDANIDTQQNNNSVENVENNNSVQNEEDNVDEKEEDATEEENKSENTEKEEVANNSVSKETGRIYYHEGFSGKNYYLAKELTGDAKSKVSQIVNSLKALPDNDYLENVENQEFTPLNSSVSVNDVVIEKDTIKIDFNKNFTDGLGSSGESSIIESIVNSVGYNLNVNKVIITFNGENYSSGHTYMEDGEYFEVNKSNAIELQK